MKKVSIIVPVYNAEKTLDKCLQSLINQDYKSIEAVFVNDCSSDGSLRLLEDFCVKNNSECFESKVISHNVNKGVACARNTGLDNSSGEYIYFLDADDMLDGKAVSEMVAEAESKFLDIVGIEWFLSFNENERYMKQADFWSPQQALENMMCGVMRWNLWLFMARRSLYEDNKIRFENGQDMGEDMMVVFKLFMNAKKVALLKKPYYHYQQININSLTKQYSSKHIEQVTNNVSNIESYIKNRGERNLLDYLPFLKLNIKLPLLISCNTSNYKLWGEWFCEANKYVLKNKKLPFRTRILQWFACKKIYVAVKLYYILVYKFVYGVIFK